MSNIVISVDEEYKIYDELAKDLQLNPNTGPRGWVQVYLDHKKVHEGPNLIVAKGREFVAQKIFELNTTSDAQIRPNYYNYKVSHFAVGSGGASIVGNDVNLQGPMIGDSYLYQPISLITGSGYLNEPSGYEDSTEDPVVHSYKNAVKDITAAPGSIVLEAVEYDNSPSFYTKIKCTCVVPSGEPSQIQPGASVQISEAGLYFVNTGLADTDPLKVNMFAHICFTPKWKEKESTLTILWYILC